MGKASLGIYLRSALFLAVQTAITVVLTPIVLLVSLLPQYQYRYLLARFWARLLILAASTICGLKYEIEGL